MVASIGVIASPSQGVSYFERDGYYTKDDPAHREASAWAGKGAEALELSGPVDSAAFEAILEGRVPGGPHLGKRDRDGEMHHRPGRDVTLSAPKSVSLMALVGGDHRIVASHDRAVTRTLGWVERNAVETRMQDKASGAMVHAGGQKMVAATFRHDTSRNLDPQLHTHAVVANMVQGEDGKWRTMVNDGLYRNKMAIGAVYRAELARGLKDLGYGIEKTHADGRFEISGVSREVVEGFSTRRAEIEAAMMARDEGAPLENPKLADRAALMTRARKQDVDKGELRRSWERQAAELGFSADTVRAKATRAERERPVPDLFTDRGQPAVEAAAWALEHLSERQTVFPHGDLLAAALAREPGAVTAEAAERAIAGLEDGGGLHAAMGLDPGKHWTTDAAMARESEAIALMKAGQGAEKTIMRGWIAETKLHGGRLNEGQKEAVKLILSSKDRVLGVQGYAGTGKTTMLNRLRTLAESRGYNAAGLAPSASAARTLERESGIGSETVQRFLARHEGIMEGRGTARGLRNLRASFSKTVLVVDESSLASSEQMRGLLRVATTLRVPRVVLVGDEKQLGAVEAGKPFEQLRRAGMQTAVMDEILRQRDMDLKEAVRAGLAGEVRTAFEKLGDRIAQVEREDIGRGGGGTLAVAVSRRARRNRGDRADKGTSGRDQRDYPGATDRGRRGLRSREAGREAGLTRVDARRDGAGLELLGGRHGDLQPPVQDARARGGEGRLRAQHGLAWRRKRQPGGLATLHAGGREGRSGGLPGRGNGASGGRQGKVDAERSGLGARQRRDRGRGIGRKGRRRLPSRGRIGGETCRTRPTVASPRPGFCLYGARFPGQDGGPNRCRHAHGEPGPDQPAGLLRGDQPGPGRCRAGHRRRLEALGSTGESHGRAGCGARWGGDGGRARDGARPRTGPRKGRRSGCARN